MRDCKTCARDCSANESCNYINIDDAISAYEDRQNGVTEEVVHCPDCRECIEKNGYSGYPNSGWLYCKTRCSLVTETDYCSWGIRK